MTLQHSTVNSIKGKILYTSEKLILLAAHSKIHYKTKNLVEFIVSQKTNGNQLYTGIEKYFRVGH
jgi:hypothetical protein